MNAIKTQLVLTIRNLSWPKSREDIDITSDRDNEEDEPSKYCKPSP